MGERLGLRMKLSSLFVRDNQVYQEESVKESAASLEQSLKNGMEAIAGKTLGQSVTGEILEKNGADVLIAIGKNQLLKAKLDGSMVMESGQQVTFSIKNMTGGKVVLSPLFANMGRDLNGEKALQMAGLPRNGISLKMVQTMMQEGMPVDRESLRQMLGTIGMHPEADIETLIQLKKLEIPVTEETIFQLEAYKNYQHQLTEGMMEIADSLKGTLQEMTAKGAFEDGMLLLKTVLSLFDGEGEAGTFLPAGQPGELPAGKDAAFSSAETPAAADAKAAADEKAAADAPVNASALTNQLAGKETLFMQLKQAGLPEQTLLAFSEGALSGKELLLQVKQLLEQQLSEGFFPKEQREGLSALLEGKEWNGLLKNEMAKEWFLSPDEVGKEKTVEELYQRLNSQMDRLSRALLQSTGESTPLAKTVANLSGNIDFMNQLNQMFTYVQLPLKMQNQQANGELYVYTNKRNLAEKEGEVSALLHLTMEHLGSVNIHVSMREQKVATKFYLQDDSALDLIADHIDMLNNRLNKRGYTMSASFQLKEGETNVMEEILKKDKPVSVLSGYSFDARA